MNQRADVPNLPTIDVDATTGEPLPSDTTRIARYGAWAIGIGFGGFLLWAAFAPLDEGVPNSGVVSVDTKRKAVQHLSGGLVREVLVREGQMVEAGQVVLRLDDAVSRANYQSSRHRYMELRAAEGRLTAEQLGLPAIDFHPDLLAAAKTDPLIQQHITAQNQLLQSRRASLAANLAAIDESIQGQRALIEGYRGVLASRSNQAASYEREVKVGCGSCVAECAAGGEKETAMLASALRMAGKMNGEDVGISEKTIDRQCVKEFVIQLDDVIDQYDAILSLGCGAGVQAIADMYPEVPVIPALNTEFMGETKDQGYWVESCIGCGDCMLYYFGGVCPLTRCSKQLLNGPCGGSMDGKCEVNPEVPCAWQLIIDRLTNFGALDRLEMIYPPKDWSKKQGAGPRKIIREDQQGSIS